MMIVCLGVGFFVGIKATAPSMRATAEQYFNDTSLMDLEILSTTGFDDEDVSAIRDIEGVSKVMPSYTADLILDNALGSLVVRVSSLPGGNSNFDTINELTLLEGRMPAAENECLISESGFVDEGDEGYKVGDVITFNETAGNNSADDIVSNRTYTVVGLIESSSTSLSVMEHHPSGMVRFLCTPISRPPTSHIRVIPRFI
jgi:putative ABC transport system permease protein